MAERLKRIEARLLRGGLTEGSIRKTQDTSRPGRERITWRSSDTNLMTNIKEKDIQPLVDRGWMEVNHGNYYNTTELGKQILAADDELSPALAAARRVDN